MDFAKPFAKKRFGQNFLHDPNIIRKINHAINSHSEDHVVEIGPGTATLTQTLLNVACLDVIEIDRDLIADLEFNLNIELYKPEYFLNRFKQAFPNFLNVATLSPKYQPSRHETSAFAVFIIIS